MYIYMHADVYMYMYVVYIRTHVCSIHSYTCTYTYTFTIRPSGRPLCGTLVSRNKTKTKRIDTAARSRNRYPHDAAISDIYEQLVSIIVDARLKLDGAALRYACQVWLDGVILGGDWQKSTPAPEPEAARLYPHVAWALQGMGGGGGRAAGRHG